MCENRKSEHFHARAFSFKLFLHDFLQRETDNPNTGITEQESRGLLTDSPNIYEPERDETTLVESLSRHARSRAMHHHEQESSENIRGSKIASEIKYNL